MNDERDELADELADSIFRHTGVTTSSSKSMADELLTAGYRKPRTINTVGGLDALGRNAVIMQPGGTVLVNDGQAEDPWASYMEDPFGGPIWTDSAHVTLPVTVLHEGDAE